MVRNIYILYLIYCNVIDMTNGNGEEAIEGRGTVKKIEKGNMVTVEDDRGSKKMIHGSIEGFAIKKPSHRRTSSVIIGLDKDWEGKRVLCILLE